MWKMVVKFIVNVNGLFDFAQDIDGEPENIELHVLKFGFAFTTDSGRYWTPPTNIRSISWTKLEKK